MSRLVRMTSALLALGMLASCSDSSPAREPEASSLTEYCASVKEAQQAFGGLSAESVTPDGIESMRDKLEEMGKLAPASVADDYRSLSSAFDDVDEILGSIGLSLSDFGDREKMTAALSEASPKQVKAIQDAAASMSSEKMASASKAISKQVKADCKISLGN